MQTKLIVVVALMLSLSSIAQQGINYKALIKDGDGNLVANQNITVQFSIYEGAALSTMVYQETHTTSTDGNGIIIINIGEGTQDNGAFTTINWGSDAYYLNTQIDTGSGLVDMGTTAFKTVPYALHAANVSGLEVLDEGIGSGWRLKGRDPENYADIGSGAVDLSTSQSPSSTTGAYGDYSTATGLETYASGTNSVAMGNRNTATGTDSFAIGRFTIASGNNSTAMGLNTIASGYNSVAIGSITTASGDHAIAMGEDTMASGSLSTAMGGSTNASGSRSTAMGDFSTASGHGSVTMGGLTNASGAYSTAMGFVTTAATYASVAIGRNNTGFGNAQNSWLETDPLFEIGNGTSTSDKSNAFTVLKNGKIGIGTSTPFTPLHIEGGTDANLTDANDGFLIIGSLFGTNLVFDNNEIIARNVLNTSTLFLQANGGDVSVGGSVVHSSDRRLKRDIKPIFYGLQAVLKLEPKAYYWKNRPEQKERSFGLIAQEVQSILKELVLKNEKDSMLSVNYTELIPILIKAIQEQQDIIDSQKKNYAGLFKRVEHLEALVKIPKQ